MVHGTYQLQIDGVAIVFMRSNSSTLTKVCTIMGQDGK